MRSTQHPTATLGTILGFTLASVGSPAFAAQQALDTTNPLNGLTDIFSQTFDGNLQNPFCDGLSGLARRDCQFFSGVPGPTRGIAISPNPTGLGNIVPGGITGAGTGSFLDLTLGASNAEVTLAGGVIAFPSGLVLDIQGSTLVTPSGIAGFVIEPSARTVPVDANGVAEIRVNTPGATSADFSTFNVIVVQPADCSGPLCGLIPLLTLDMVRYRLLIDFSPDFTSFTASFVGQTANTSLVFATLNSVAPEIAVADSVAPDDDLQVPYGDVTELTTSTETVTVTNTGTADLLLGAVADANPLAAPFALLNDNCTAQTLAPAASCTFDVSFTPGSVGNFSDSLDIPSNDPATPAVTVSVSGNGVAALVPNINVSDSVPPATDRNVPFGSIAIGAQADQTLTVGNTGNANLEIGQVGAANPLAAPFSVVNDNCSAQTIAPAGNCTIGLRFEPLAAGAVTDSLDIPSNDPDEPSVTVNVSGTGAALAVPNIVVTDDAPPTDDRQVPFGNVTEATTRDRTVTVSNNGGAPLVLGNVAQANGLAAPFSVFSNNCSGESLAPAGSCTVVIRYAPPGLAIANDSFDVPSNDPDEPSVVVSVSGTGIAAGEGGVDTPRPAGASSGFMAMDPLALLALGLAGLWAAGRRRPARPR